jgi:predicted nuclease of restriction endonuclease-like (RecB) superfamily
MKKLEPIVKQIKNRLSEARNKAASEVNTAMLQAYWDIGRIIVEYEQDGEIKAQYGQQLLTELSKELTKSIGRGFSKSNLYNMRNFYLEYQIFQTVSGKLTWSHYCELLGIADKNEREFYQNECINSLWSVRELDRQIETRLKMTKKRSQRMTRMDTNRTSSMIFIRVNSCNSLITYGG